MTTIKQSNKRFELRDISDALTAIEGRLDTLEAASSGITVVKAKGSSTSSVANTTANVTWNTPVLTDASISISSADITINEDGVYLFDVAVMATAGNRLELIIHTEIDTGGGYSEDTSEISHNYVARNATQDKGGMVLTTALDLNDGDKVRFVAEGVADGTAVLQTAGTRLRIIK